MAGGARAGPGGGGRAVVGAGVARVAGDTPKNQRPAASRSGPARTGLRLLVADAPAPFVTDLDRGTVQPIRGLPTTGQRLVSVLPVGRHALVLSTRICQRCRGPSVSEVYLLRRGATAASRIGAALTAVPAHDGRAVWMLSRRGAHPCVLTRFGLDGRPGRADPVPCRGDLVADLPAGLLFSAADRLGRDAHSELHRPNGGTVRVRAWQAEPVVGNLLLTGAEPGRPLLLHNLRSGAAHRLRWPTRAGYSLRAVTGRPSGRLAIVDFGRYSPRHRRDIWLLDTVTGSWRHLPGMPARLVPKATHTAWTPDGRVVIVSGDVLALWRPGEAQLALGRVRPAGQPGSQFIVW